LKSQGFSCSVTSAFWQGSARVESLVYWQVFQARFLSVGWFLMSNNSRWLNYLVIQPVFKHIVLSVMVFPAHKPVSRKSGFVLSRCESLSVENWRNLCHNKRNRSFQPQFGCGPMAFFLARQHFGRSGHNQHCMHWKKPGILLAAASQHQMLFSPFGCSPPRPFFPVTLAVGRSTGNSY
jgi:hypothetical protein